MLSLAEIRSRLEDRPAVLVESEEPAQAAVALVVCDGETGLEVLFIERSEHEQDPWSGHLGFPGGRIEPEDSGLRAAAERETLEEVGLNLAMAEYLGRLDDVHGARLPVVVSCFVFGMRYRPEITPNLAEVRHAFWLPFSDLFDPRRRREKVFDFRGELSTYPALQILGEGRPWLWGITYRLVLQFAEALGRPWG